MVYVDEVCDRVKIINAIEETGLCSDCPYCTFLEKLKTQLKELSFFKSNAHIQKWYVQYIDKILKVEPRYSLSLDNKSN